MVDMSQIAFRHHDELIYGVSQEDFNQLKRELSPFYLINNPHIPLQIRYNPQREIVGIFLTGEKSRIVFNKLEVPIEHKIHYTELRDALLERLDRVRILREGWID